MLSRRKSRISAMQILYQIQQTRDPAEYVLEQFWLSQDIPTNQRNFTLQLVDGTMKNLINIDSEIQTVSKNWKLNRMPAVDLSILRMATYEILYINDIDSATSINEAVEIAKVYSTEKSPKFINGVLDNISKRNQKNQ